MNIIAYSIPVFFVLIGVEWWFSRSRDLGLYRFSDSVADLSCGIVNQVVSVFTAASLFAAYWFVHEHFAVFDWPETSPWVWCAGLIAVDFTYYWFHRTAHEHNLLWVTHSPHHSSEEYNLTVALRQGAIEPWAAWLFRLPLAILGLPPLVYLSCNAINTVYQFWVHTRLVDRAGPLEAVLVTPSHHRVHHGCDPKYLDRNYSGMFIVWDRLFGTFQVEEEPPTYGVVRQVASWNPIWANLEHAAKVRDRARGLPWRDQARLWWAGPAIFAASGAEIVAGRPKYDARVTPRTVAYVLAHFAIVLVATVALLFAAASLPGLERVLLGAFVVVSVASLGGILDGSWWAAPLEGLRLASIPALGVALAGDHPSVLVAAGLVLAASLLHLGVGGGTVLRGRRDWTLPGERDVSSVGGSPC